MFFECLEFDVLSRVVLNVIAAVSRLVMQGRFRSREHIGNVDD